MSGGGEGTTEIRTVGFIGLGTMGIEMTRNLLKAGHSVRVFNVVPAALQTAKQAGAMPCGSVAEAAGGAFIVVTMLPDTPQVEEVVLGAEGPRSNPPTGKLVVDMSTISPQAVRAMASALKVDGIDLLDAPVSGGPQGARSGTLTIMAGGTQRPTRGPARFWRPCMGTTINHAGASGAGQTVKLCNQLMVGINLQAACGGHRARPRVGRGPHADAGSADGRLGGQLNARPARPGHDRRRTPRPGSGSP